MKLQLPKITEVRTLRAQRSFEYFVRRLKPEFELQWFHRRICNEVQAWADSRRPYVLILEMPPGHAKSTYAKLACAWLHARDAENRIIYTSYGQELADEHCGEVQDMQMSEIYRELCPDVRLNERRSVTDTSGRGARRTKDRHDIIGHGGGFRAVGVGGSITGFRADAIVIDDPLKGPKEAASATLREDQWRFYNRTLKTRRRPGRPLRFLVLLTRWNLDDLAGRIKDREKNWRSVSFEALREDMSDPDDPRGYHEALWSDVIDADELKEIKELDPSGFAALYQQSPVPEGGAIIKTVWTENRYTTIPAGPGTWIWSCDPKAGSKDPDSSRVAIQLWFQPRAHPGTVYLIDQVKGVWDQPETLAEFRRLSKLPLWKNATAKLVENKADGKSVVANLKSNIPGLILVEPQGDKVVRARAVAPYWAAGNVFLPDESISTWIGEFIQELITFPAAPHDDQVDAMALALSYLFITDGHDPIEHLRRITGRT